MRAGGRPRRSQPGAAAVSAQDLRRGGDADLRGPAAASELGARQAPGLARAAPPEVDLPAVSTAGDLLARKGLVKKRRRRRPFKHPGVVPTTTTHPNDLWTADFKGHFRTRDGVYCYPLTVADQHTRYLLGVTACSRRKAPACARSSTGCSASTGCRTRFAPTMASRSRPGDSRPVAAQCLVAAARHSASAHPARAAAGERRAERMHKTLKAEAIRPRGATLVAQQRAFNRFQQQPAAPLGTTTVGNTGSYRQPLTTTQRFRCSHVVASDFLVFL